jgi:MFS family permease
MTITILIYSIFTGLSAVARAWGDFAAFRFLCGLGIGGEYAAGVALVAEVMPSRARPYCLRFLQGFAALGHVGGSLVSLLIGPQAEINGVAGWRWLFAAGVLPSLLALIIRWRLKEPESWVRAREDADRRKTEQRPQLGVANGPDEFHRQLGDVREIIRSRQLMFHVAIGMALGVCGQIGLWSIGYWTPELIRGSQLELRRMELATNIANRSGNDKDPLPGLRELADAVGRSPQEAATLEAQWRTNDDQLVAYGTVLQDLAGMCGIYAFTFLTARKGRRFAFASSYLLAFAVTLFTFSCMRQASDVLWMTPLLGFGVSSVYGGFAIYFPELFPTRLRSTGTGLCYNAARYVTAFGPLLLGKLTAAFASTGMGLPLRGAAASMSMIYLLGLVAVKFAPETHGKALPE